MTKIDPFKISSSSQFAVSPDRIDKYMLINVKNLIKTYFAPSGPLHPTSRAGFLNVQTSTLKGFLEQFPSITDAAQTDEDIAQAIVEPYVRLKRRNRYEECNSLRAFLLSLQEIGKRHSLEDLDQAIKIFVGRRRL